MADIKLITKDTDINSINIKKLPWDIVVHNIPYYVAHFEGYVHSIGGKWGDNDMWAWPRNMNPTYENLVEFDANTICNWGLEYKESYFLKSKWDETSLRQSSGTMIKRNGKDFYFVSGTMDYSLAKARTILTKIQEGFLNVFEIGYQKSLDNKLITYKGIPAIIERYIEGQGCVIISYYGPEKYNEIVQQIWQCEEIDSVKLDVVGYDHSDIIWFPEYNEEYELNTIDIFEKYFDLKGGDRNE